MHPLEIYLEDIRAIRSSGAAVKETSYYPALANLLNEVGKSLKPKVRCIIHLQDTGAGLPDGAGAASPLEPFIAIVEYIARFWAGGTGPDLWAVNVGRQPPEATKFSGRCGYR